MYGHAAPPPRGSGSVIPLRVLYCAVGFLTCGLLACVPLFRVAVLRGRWPDWVLAWGSIPLAVAGFAVVGSLPESDHRTDAALAGIILLGAISSAYFVMFDIRHQRELASRMPMATTAYPPAQPGYGYPQQPSPYAVTQPAAPHLPAPPVPGPHTPVPHHTPVPRQTPAPQPPAHQTPVPQAPAPQRPAPARIDQVRAELDELSDYLRKQEGDR
ncbi:hypothetical protein ACFY93_11525 [Streptomyces sp. NPDC008313]|uniref:hypothetical protein n=1 Tax=Streptomyces sp. NPDC008313 TaxID=3364826 RepID=UPI0036EF5353